MLQGDLQPLLLRFLWHLVAASVTAAAAPGCCSKLTWTPTSLDPSQPAATSRLSAHINNPGPDAGVQQQQQQQEQVEGAVPGMSTAAHF